MVTKFEDSGTFREVVNFPDASTNMKRVCLVCGLTFGDHYSKDCPTEEEQKALKELYGTN